MVLLAPAFPPCTPSLSITTFEKGQGSVFFKALGHPALQEQRFSFLRSLKTKKEIALFDPSGFGADTIALLDLKAHNLTSLFVHALERKETSIAGFRARLLSELIHCQIDLLLIADFQSSKFLPLLKKFLPQTCEVKDLAPLKLPDSDLTNPKTYLDPLNFATNFAFFKDAEGTHTRLTTVNYWHRYGGKNVRLACMLFALDGQKIAEWVLPLDAAEHLIILDSTEIRTRFKLPPFTGQLFLHVLGAQGHDVVKYALDIYSDDGQVYGSTHDANAWPSEYFAGLPAPHLEEDVVLWIQNAHPVHIPKNTIQLNVMGKDDVSYRLPESISPFASLPISLQQALPGVCWPCQVEVKAGRYCVRPRYEVVRQTRRTISHINVEREDLAPDPKWPRIASHFGKGYLLTCPLFPLSQFHQKLLPTPMSRLYTQAPVKVSAYTAEGKRFAEKWLGNLPRSHRHTLDISEWLKNWEAFGHLELSYDLTAGEDVDGWLHALFRYQECQTGHLAETTFGCHLFNHPLTYKNEPQSYSGLPPGLSTRLFLRLAPAHARTFCYLIYPVSENWNSVSHTTLYWMNSRGQQEAETSIQIPQSGSRFLWVDELFPSLAQKAQDSFIFVTDPTCRLFGYHGTSIPGKAFSLDHMFGF